MGKLHDQCPTNTGSLGGDKSKGDFLCANSWHECSTDQPRVSEKYKSGQYLLNVTWQRLTSASIQCI